MSESVSQLVTRESVKYPKYRAGHFRPVENVTLLENQDFLVVFHLLYFSQDTEGWHLRGSGCDSAFLRF